MAAISSFGIRFYPEATSRIPLPQERQQMDFDVRELAAELHMRLDEVSHVDVLRAAIDRGIIKPRRVFQL